MVDLQSNILEKLRCSKCNGYLSYAPIMLTENGEKLCGRCVNNHSNIKLIPYKAYEDIAGIVAFPCHYKESGCGITIPREDVIVHEDYCEYRPTECPVAPQGTCKWKGPQCSLLDHYKTTHPELILEHPCSLDADIVVDNDKNMLLSFKGFVFLVQIRCNTVLSKLWHCVHCFAMPQIAQQFSFCVQFNSDEGSFKREKPVLAEKHLTMQIDKSVETDVNGLLELLGNCKNIKVVLSILPKVDSDLLNEFLCSDCKDSALPAVFRNLDKYYCSECKQETPFLDRNKEYLYGKVLKACNSNNFGCSYVNINKKLLRRHEIWECKSQQKCFFGCALKFDELHSHFVNKTHDSIINKCLDFDCWYYQQIKHNGDIFLCKYLMRKTRYVTVYIYSQLPVEIIHLYKCVLTFDREPSLTSKCTPTAEHDWEIHECCLENRPFVYANNKLCSKIRKLIISKLLI